MADKFECPFCWTTVVQPEDRESDPSCKCRPTEVTGEEREYPPMLWVGQV